MASSKQQEQNAKKEVAKYKKQLEDKASLFEIGERVRARFFLNKNGLIWSGSPVTKEQLDQEKLDKCNEAAHGGNGAADAALIVAMQKKGKYVKEYKDIFRELYFCSVEGYHTKDPRLKKALDLNASICADRRNPCAQEQRAAFLNLLGRVMGGCTAYEEHNRKGGNAELAIPRIDRWLARLVEIKVEIVRICNQRRGNRRGARPSQRIKEVTGIDDSGPACDGLDLSAIW